MPYATFGQRVRASLVDGLGLASNVVIAGLLVGPIDPWGYLTAAAMYGPFLIFEPLQIRLWRQTFGQRLVGLRVFPARSDMPLTLCRLVARHLCKGMCLGLSPAYELFDPRGRSIHDILFGTVVLHGHPTGLDQLPAPTHVGSAPRRFVAFLLWYVLASVVLLSLLIIPIVVIEEIHGIQVLDGPYKGAVDFAFTAVSIALFVLLANRAAAGHLPGAKRRQAALAE